MTRRNRGGVSWWIGVVGGSAVELVWVAVRLAWGGGWVGVEWRGAWRDGLVVTEGWRCWGGLAVGRRRAE